MKHILLSIQDQLQAAVPALKYIDKNWGQLNYDQPPVQWPCALVDIESVNYSQMGKGYQKAEADIVITVGNVNHVRSSALAACKTDSYETIELLDNIHQVLQLYTDGQHFQPLQRTNLRKVFSDKGAEIYTMTYKTAFIVEKQTATQASVMTQLSINESVKNCLKQR